MIHHISDNESEQRSFYRILHNERVDIEEVKSYIYSDCQRQVVAGHHYLVFQDTTQPNFERNRKNIRKGEGLGVIGDKESLGFFLHPSLVVDAESGRCIGYSHITHWHRESGHASKEERKYWNQPIEEKESYRWIESSHESTLRLMASGASMVTMIADRESDITALFERVKDCNLLVRSCKDRLIQEGRLYQHLSEQPLSGTYTIQVRHDERIGRSARRATIEVRYSKVSLTPYGYPKNASIEVWGIEAREVGCPEGVRPICWHLLTTHVIDSHEAACKAIDWYGQRWNIEQVFRLSKQKGFNVEGSDMESGKALIILTLLSLLAISKVFTLHTVSKISTPQPIAEAFDEQELECLRQLCTKYEGNTQRQKNPYTPDSLQWCYWVIARLGGWKPQEKQAGVIVLMRGWMYFQKIFYGFSLARCSFVS